jgi:hypothetical protein
LKPKDHAKGVAVDKSKKDLIGAKVVESSFEKLYLVRARDAFGEPTLKVVREPDWLAKYGKASAKKQREEQRKQTSNNKK